MTTDKKSMNFSETEKEAMRERAKELRSKTVDGEQAVLDKIRAMPEPDKTLAKKIHTLVMTAAPFLKPRTWYGMPAYTKNGKVVCFFQSGKKFTSRYSTFGFQDAAHLDDGNMWATGFAIKKLSAADEAKITSLVKKATSNTSLSL